MILFLTKMNLIQSMILLKMIAITAIVCYLIDLSGFVTSVKQAIWKWVFKDKPFKDFELKPFSCSLCMSHHILLIYLICTSSLCVETYLLCCLLSFFSSSITSLLITSKDFVAKIDSKLQQLVDKI